MLMIVLIECVRVDGMYVMIGGIESGNIVFIVLYECFGFCEVGCML